MQAKHVEDLAMTTAEMLEKKGREEGREEGIKEAKLENARKMLLEGDSLEKVIRITDLTAEELKKAGLI